MTALLFEPHQDDAALFCAFNAIRYRAHVVTVLRSVKQESIGITADVRESETAEAMTVLGCTWGQWPFPDDVPPWERIERAMVDADKRLAPARIFAPWPEEHGHEHHNRVGVLAGHLFGERVTYYTTYKPGGDRTTGTPVPYEPEWVTLKLRALACYRSQIETVAAGCTDHFMRSLEEYVKA